MTFSLEGIAALIALGITCLGILCGASWWCSALYTQVCQIGKCVSELQASVIAATRGQAEINEDIYDKLDDHGHRISKLEG